MIDLYNMELHDEHVGDVASIMRVPGGWLYLKWAESDSGAISTTSCFVPFNNEFMDKKDKNKE